METAALTGYIDVAQVVLYVFWIFFAGLILYLRREDKREGYPLESDRSDRVKVQGFPSLPKPKIFKLANGETVRAPQKEAPVPVANAKPSAPWPGAPLDPVGDPMLAGVGPGSAGTRANVPEMAADGKPKIQPMSLLKGYTVARQDPDPRGKPVIGRDGEVAGTVADLWIDREEPQIRYLEMELEAGGRVMVPMTLVKMNTTHRTVTVRSLRSKHFADIPKISGTDSITKQEEENVVAYFGAGQLYGDAYEANRLSS